MEIYDFALDVKGETGYGFYDSLILASAIYSGCKALLSEDLQNGQLIKGVKIVNPFIAEKEGIVLLLFVKNYNAYHFTLTASAPPKGRSWPLKDGLFTTLPSTTISVEAPPSSMAASLTPNSKSRFPSSFPVSPAL